MDTDDWEWEVLTRFLTVIEMMVKFLKEYKAVKKFSAKDERYPLLLQSTTLSVFPAYCEFSLSDAWNMEPFLTVVETEQSLVIFLCKQLKDLILAIFELFIKQDVLQKIPSVFQLINLDFKCEQNHLSTESIDVVFWGLTMF